MNDGKTQAQDQLDRLLTDYFRPETAPVSLGRKLAAAARESETALTRLEGKLGIEASLGILFERPRLARAYRLRGCWNVVLPAARKSGHAKALLLTATSFADRIGRVLYLDACLPPQRVPITPEIEASPKVRLCSRHLASAGRIFAHVPNTSAA